MARIYFRRGWNERAAERLVLLDRLLSLEPNPPVSAGLRELARLHAAADARLGQLSATA
jgi:hypothetical protein